MGKAFNPDPRLDFLLGFAEQGLEDASNPNLSVTLRIERMAVVGLESMGTGVASDAVGVLGFLAGEAVVPEGGGIVGYGVGSVTSSLYLDSTFWTNYNSTYFSNLGF